MTLPEVELDLVYNKKLNYIFHQQEEQTFFIKETIKYPFEQINDITFTFNEPVVKNIITKRKKNKYLYRRFKILNISFY